MSSAPTYALYLGRHAPLSQTAFPQTLRGPHPAIPVLLAGIAGEGVSPPNAGFAPRPEMLRYSLPSTGAVTATASARTLPAQITVAPSLKAQDALLTQTQDGDVFAECAGTEGLPHGQQVTITPIDHLAFMARFAHNQLSAGDRPQCFCTGTFIHTPRGPLPVEDIRVGFPVQTLDNGVQPVRWIGTTLHTEPRAHAPIEIAAGALGRGFPSVTLRVSPYHRLCLRSSIAMRMFGQAEILLSARFLLDAPGVRQVDGEIPVRYWHIATARHALVSANGTWAETLFPGLQAPPGMDASDVSQLEVVFDQKLARGKDEAAQAKPPVRPILRGAAQRAFVARHLKQRRAFVMQQLDAGDDEPAQAS